MMKMCVCFGEMNDGEQSRKKENENIDKLGEFFGRTW